MFMGRRAIATALISALAIAGCSQPNDSTPLISFEIPNTWYSLDVNGLNAAQTSWLTATPSDAITEATMDLRAWATSPNIDAADLFSNTPPQRMQAVTFTRPLFTEEVAALSENPENLKDVVLAVNSKVAGDGLDVRLNLVNTSTDIYFLQQELAWDFGGVTQSIKIRAAADLTKSTLSVFWLRCSDTCFISEAKTSEKIISSIRIG